MASSHLFQIPLRHSAINEKYNTSLGREVGRSDGAGSHTTVYNAYSEVTSERFPLATNSSATVSRTYDSVGRPKTILLKGTTAAVYTYDAATGRYATVKNNSATVTYSYLDKTNLPLVQTWQKGTSSAFLTVSNTYDAYNRLTLINANSSNQAAYVYDSLGRRTSATLQDDTAWNYSYNQRSEITSAIRKNASNVTQNTMRYGFDSIGNRTSSYENPTSKTYSANSLNQYTGINVVGSSSISPQYDDDGNMTGYGSWTYTWDAENRLVKAVNGTTRLEFIYDALSRRVAKKLYQGNTLSKHERYVYDGMKLLASYNAKSSFAKINTFLWQPFGADVPLIMTYGSTIYGYLVDANKNVLGLFNPSQSRVATYLYGPFGQIISSSGTIAANNPIRFSSEQFDADLGLVYYNYRYYSPELGRWLSKDPIGEKGGWNLYLMCRNNVVNVWDERGQIADWVVWIVAGAIILTMNGCTKPEKKTTPQEDGKENCTIHIFMGHGRLFDKNDPQNSEVDPNSMIGNYAQQFAGDEPNPFAGVAIVGCWAKETMIAVDKKREQEKKKPINWIYSASSNIPNIREINRRGEDRLTPRGIENVFYIPRTKGELEKEVLDAAEEYAKRICNTKNNCCKEIRIVLTNATDFEWFSELPKVIPCKK